jgi:hypothetical protein
MPNILHASTYREVKDVFSSLVAMRAPDVVDPLVGMLRHVLSERSAAEWTADTHISVAGFPILLNSLEDTASFRFNEDGYKWIQHIVAVVDAVVDGSRTGRAAVVGYDRV